MPRSKEKPLNEGAGARKTSPNVNVGDHGARKPVQRPHQPPKK